MAGLADCDWDDWRRDGDPVANHSAGIGAVAMRFFWWLARPSVFARATVICVVYFTADQLAWNAAIKSVTNSRVNAAGLSDTEIAAVQSVVVNMIERKKEHGTSSNPKPEARASGVRTHDQNGFGRIGEVAADSTGWR